MAKNLKVIINDLRKIRNSLRSRKAGMSRKDSYIKPSDKVWAKAVIKATDETRRRLNDIIEILEKLRG